MNLSRHLLAMPGEHRSAASHLLFWRHRTDSPLILKFNLAQFHFNAHDQTVTAIPAHGYLVSWKGAMVAGYVHLLGSLAQRPCELVIRPSVPTDFVFAVTVEIADDGLGVFAWLLKLDLLVVARQLAVAIAIDDPDIASDHA